jgi:hypothetical protein
MKGIRNWTDKSQKKMESRIGPKEEKGPSVRMKGLLKLNKSVNMGGRITGHCHLKEHPCEQTGR